jgi:Mce-associated membrane protein
MKIRMNIGALLSWPADVVRRRSARMGTWSARRVRLTLGIFAVGASASLAGAVYTGTQLHDDSATADAGRAAVDTARTSVPALLTYDFNTVDQQFKARYDSLAGEFKNEFQSLGDQRIIPVAKDRHIVTKAEVAASGVVAQSRNDVSVLMFVNQTTTNSDSPDPKLDGSRIRVSMTKTPDGWRIAGLEPI